MSDEAEVCPICQCGPILQDGWFRKAETPCQHTFHARCLMRWEYEQIADGRWFPTCPICRENTQPTIRTVIEDLMVNGRMTSVVFEFIDR